MRFTALLALFGAASATKIQSLLAMSQEGSADLADQSVGCGCDELREQYHATEFLDTVFDSVDRNDSNAICQREAQRVLQGLLRALEMTPSERMAAMQALDQAYSDGAEKTGEEALELLGQILGYDGALTEEDFVVLLLSVSRDDRHDGLVTSRSLKRSLHRLGIDLPFMEAWRLMFQFDNDRNGGLCQTELDEWIAASNFDLEDEDENEEEEDEDEDENEEDEDEGCDCDEDEEGCDCDEDEDGCDCDEGEEEGCCNDEDGCDCDEEESKEGYGGY